MLSAGIDIGTRTLKVCLVEEGKLLGAKSLTMERDLKKLMKSAMAAACEEARIRRGRKTKRCQVKPTHV